MLTALFSGNFSSNLQVTYRSWRYAVFAVPRSCNYFPSTSLDWKHLKYFHPTQLPVLSSLGLSRYDEPSFNLQTATNLLILALFSSPTVLCWKLQVRDQLVYSVTLQSAGSGQTQTRWPWLAAPGQTEDYAATLSIASRTSLCIAVVSTSEECSKSASR